jgi:hypothetical protein
MRHIMQWGEEARHLGAFGQQLFWGLAFAAASRAVDATLMRISAADGVEPVLEGVAF